MRIFDYARGIKILKLLIFILRNKYINYQKIMFLRIIFVNFIVKVDLLHQKYFFLIIFSFIQHMLSFLFLKIEIYTNMMYFMIFLKI